MQKASTPSILLCQLYSLGPTDQDWVYVSIGYININQKNELVMLDKDTNQEVHRHLIQQKFNYQATDLEAIQFTIDTVDFALSFQQKSGAEAVWEGLSKVIAEQQKNNSQSDDEDINLTPVNKETIPKILETMNQLVLQGNQTKNILSNYLINKKGYLDKLTQLFEELEKEKNMALLNIMCNIVKNIVTVAEHELFQIILSEQYYLFIFGALEYDEEMQKKEFIPHRTFLQKQSNFIQVVQLKSKEKQRLIHFIYRLSYLRDCGLAYYIDEMQLIFIKINCYGELIRYIENSKDFLIEVMDQLRNYNSQALQLFLEICQILKEYQELNRIVIYQKLSEYGLYDILEEYLFEYTKGFQKLKAKQKKNKQKISDDQLSKIVAMVLELLNICLQHQSVYFKLHIVSDHQQVLKYPLFNLIIDQVFNNQDHQVLFSEILKLLIDNTEENNQCLEIFLNIFSTKIASHISHQSTPNQKLQFLDICYELSRNMKICIRETFIQNNICQKISFILKENNKFEQIKCLQLMKSLILIRDEELNVQILDFLPSFVDYFLLYRRIRENLIFSQLLEIVRIVYEGINQSLQQCIENQLKLNEAHPNYQRIYNIIKTTKQECLKKQFSQTSVISEHKAQNQNNAPELRVDDEIDLFKSLQGHNMKPRPNSKQLVDYEEDYPDSVQKKVKKD